MTGGTWSLSNLHEFCVEQLLFTPTSIYTNDTCLLDSTVLLSAATLGATSYVWQDGSTGSTFTASSTGIYWVDITTAQGCTVRDTIVVDACQQQPCNRSLDLGPDVTICENGVFSLNAGGGFAGYRWQDNSVDSTYTATEGGLY